ncbi:MAG: hypothetical protein KGI69_04200 [Patescibacteria group bacterium]|nr:hypothetical protein [Patescibacteria group bacterium]
MDIESKELQDYIESSIKAISSGVAKSGYKIIKPIEFNLAVTNITEGKGGLKIYVASAEGKLKSEEISHIRFEANPTTTSVNQFKQINHFKDSAK